MVLSLFLSHAEQQNVRFYLNKFVIKLKIVNNK